MASPALNRVRRTASVVLSGAARMLGGAAQVVGHAADALRPGEATAADVADVYRLRGQVHAPPQEPVATPGEAEGPTHARTSPSHIADLADRPASDVIAAVAELSTDELRLLLEHEQAHRRRKTVLAAIERAAEQHAT